MVLGSGVLCGITTTIVVVAVLVSLPIVWIKYSDAGNVREKGIVLAHSFGHNPQVHQVH